MHFVCQTWRQLPNAGHKGEDLGPACVNCYCFPLFITSQLIKEKIPGGQHLSPPIFYTVMGGGRRDSAFVFLIEMRCLVRKSLSEVIALNVLINF